MSSAQNTRESDKITKFPISRGLSGRLKVTANYIFRQLDERHKMMPISIDVSSSSALLMEGKITVGKPQLL